MKAELTAVAKRDGEWWIGWIEEVPGANAQEKTKEELLTSLRQAAIDIIEVHRESALSQAGTDFEEIALAI